MDLLHSVDNGNAEEHNTLTKDEFLTALKTFEWKARDFTAPPVSFFGGVIYECDFWKPTLGFRVKMDEQDGLLSVSDVVDDDVRPVVGKNDIIRAINGAPLGLGTNMPSLAAKMRGLKRPIRLTFERYKLRPPKQAAPAPAPAPVAMQRATPPEVAESAAPENEESERQAVEKLKEKYLAWYESRRRRPRKRRILDPK